MADPNTKLLLHLNGADAAQETIDSSNSNHAISFSGTAQLDTAFKKFGLSSLLLDGNSDWLTASDHSDWDLGAGDFTLDLQTRFNSLPSVGNYMALIYRWVTGTDNRCFFWSVYNDAGSYKLLFNYSTNGTSGNNIYSSALTLAVDTFYHLAVVRDGNTLRFFHNGVAKGTGDMTGVTLFDATAGLAIGSYPGGAYYFDGWFDELRICKGIAHWTSGFTPPTEEYMDIVEPATFELALTQHAPAVTIDCTVLPAALALALTQHAPAVIIDYTAYPTAFALALTQHAPVIDIFYVTIPPFMEKDLIDPYSGGAWLWLAEITIPGQAVQRLARNTEDVTYDGNLFERFNLQIGKQKYSSDGSVPRVTLQVRQDRDRRLEKAIDEAETMLGAHVKLIRVNEKFLDTPVLELEADFAIINTVSEAEWVTFILGMPSPLLRKIPIRIGSSKQCPYAAPGLFKGPECQYAGPDSTCTGLLEDCITKGNEVHWGGEVGLDPNALRI